VEDTSAEIEAIVNSVEDSTNTEIPMEANPSETPEQTPQTPQEYEFQTGGRTIKAPIEKILGWASQGYNAGNRIGQLSKQLEDYQAKAKTWEGYEKTYKPIDEWARQNPDKWQSLLQNWQSAQYGGVPQGATPEQAAAHLPPELIQKINQFDQRFQQQDQERQVQRERSADQTLDGEIGNIRKQFSHIDFDAPDEKGNTLEYQILEHATKNGIPNFRAAFRDYCFDKLNSFSENKGREAAGRSISSKTRSDLLGKPVGQERSKGAPNLKGKNYDQIHEMILQEMSLG
jgi:hypothetical protein